MSDLITQYDEWLRDDSDVAALVKRQWLEPVEGEDAVIFPPTYTLSDTDAGGRFNKGEQVPGVYKGPKGPYGYNIDRFDDGSSVCLIDSVGSQANRIEPIFMREQYRELVPRVVVTTSVSGKQREINLLEAGHRAADAIIRFSSIANRFADAFGAIKDQGDSEPLAKLAPTSLIFGVWDSRGTQVKLPRIVRSVIRAFNVRPLHRSAQYVPPVDYVGEGILEAPQNKTQEDSMSELGLRHAPAPWTHGGVQVHGEIRREATLNLVALRALGTRGKNPLPLRRYVLGLGLVALTAPQKTFLREGCQLVPDAKRLSEWRLVRHDGKREPWDISDQLASEYARAAAAAFKVGEDMAGSFDAKRATAVLAQSKEERKKSRRGGKPEENNEQ